MKHIQWRRCGESLSLYIINKQYPDGVVYNTCRTPGLVVPDYHIPNGSKGYSTMQNCLKLGYTYLQTKEND